jgi:hypothetical protein
MKRIVLLFVGVVLIVVGIIVSQSGGRVTINNQLANPETSSIAINAIAGFLGLLGLIFLIIGIISMIRGSKQMKENQYIAKNGIPTEGTVTFVDKNWTLLVNKNPIYSIIEYTYTDNNGMQYSRKVTNANSNLVTRMGIQVGSKIPIKYSPQNHGESVIIV